MTIEISGVRIDSELRPKIVGALSEVLDRERSTPVGVLVAFFDENGPRNGPAIRCALTVSRPHRTAIHVEHTSGTRRLAFDGAFAALLRKVRETGEGARDLRRRPKKYFVARQLLGATHRGAAS